MTIIFVIIVAVIAFILGFVISKQLYIKYCVENLMFGDIILDMEGVENDLLSVELDRSPREMLDKNVIMFNLKIRQ